MIRTDGKNFILETEHTTYCFQVTDTGHLEHLYYGRKLTFSEKLNGGELEPLVEKHVFAPGNTNVYDGAHSAFSLEDMRLEMSSYGKGDIREPFVELVHADGSMTSDFLYDTYEITSVTDKRITDCGEEVSGSGEAVSGCEGAAPDCGDEVSGGKEAVPERIGDAAGMVLPHAYDETGKAEQLIVTLRDRQYDVKLELFYTVYEECDVITRSARLTNESKESIQIRRLMSMQLDFDTSDYIFTTFTGAWAREMKRNDLSMCAGKYVNASYTGTSSSRANPFVMLAKRGTTEDFGGCYGFNLIYSGNHYEAAEVGSFGKLRLVAGVNPQSFCWQLSTGAQFEAPEAVMAYSYLGYNGMSQCMHRFVREHIVRGTWKHRTRPVLLNSWEASYFDISERKLLALAKKGKEAGVELFVMDDGWFGERNDDAHSLGDWEANSKKLPGGLGGLGRKIRELGLSFGIWVEPEMVNVNSRLYAAHPDWTLEIPGKPHSEGRNQRILDLGRSEVQDFIIEKMSKVFSQADISYVKWDMNRTFSDYFSQALPAERQGETAHRYVLGLYRCMRELTARFQDIFFEGCAAGGNRFDLGMLCYFPQIWASDNTDALCRAEIQYGYSYGYPMSVIGAHVSACPNHQTLRVTPLETRFSVAAFGMLGYECNFSDMKKEEFAAVKEQIRLYKQWREVLQKGDFYRGRSFADGEAGSCLRGLPGNEMEWTCVSGDRTKAVGMLLQKLIVPNMQQHIFKPKGLHPAYRYHFYNRSLQYSVKEFGDLVNTVSPVHIRQDSIAHNLIAKFVKMDGETEDYYAYGDVLMYGGVHLHQAFGGTGYNGEVRHFPDFAARMYFMESEGNDAPDGGSC